MAKLRRAGAVEMIRSNGSLSEPYSPGVLEAGRYMAVELGTGYECTDYMLSLCEELGVDAEPLYPLPRDYSEAFGADVFRLLSSESENSWALITKPSRRSALAF